MLSLSKHDGPTTMSTVMTVYGALITLSKKNRSPITAAEKTNLQKALEEIREMGDFTNEAGQDFMFELTDTGEAHSITIVLSQYSSRDEAGAAEENDLMQADEVASLLELRTGQAFDIYTGFESW